MTEKIGCFITSRVVEPTDIHIEVEVIKGKPVTTISRTSKKLKRARELMNKLLKRTS